MLQARPPLSRPQLRRPQLVARLDVPSALLLALACVALMAAVTWAVLAAGWIVHGGGGAVVVAMAAAAEAALLAQARVRRLVAVVLAPLLALAAIIPTTLGAMPYDGNGTLAHTVARYAGALTAGLMTGSDWAFTVGLCGVLWLAGYWLGWLALRERQGMLAVIPLYAVLGTNVLNAHTPNVTALPVAIAVALSLCVVAATHLEALQARWSGVRVASLPGTRGRFAATVVVAVGVLTAAALLVPPATSSDISARLFPGSKPGAGTRSGGQVGTIEFSTGTVPGGALASNPQQVLTYSTDSAQSLYLSVVADTQFVAGNWYPDEGGVQPAPGVTFNGLHFSAGTLPRDLSTVDGSAVASATTVSADLQILPGATGGTGYALFTGEPTGVNHSGIAFGLSSTSRPGSLVTVDAVQLGETGGSVLRLHTTALVSNATEVQLRSAGTAYPVFVQQYRALPHDDMTGGGAAIAELAKEWTAGTDNPYDAASAIETHLRDPHNFTYTLTPPIAPAGVWPVVYFLTQSHQGYCQYFASAMGAMLRSLGIPTRLMNGYGPGTPVNTAAGVSGARQQQVTTSDAHTWVEAYFPGYGWIPFEPTPPSSQGVYTPIPRGNAAAVPTPGAAPTPDASALKPGFADPGVDSGTGSAPPGGLSPAVAVGLVAAGLAVLLSLYALWLFLPRSPRGAWWRLETVGILRGVRRRSSETHRQYAERLGDLHPALRAPARELAAFIARSEFSGAPADRDGERRVLRVWRTIAAATPRLLIGRRPVRPV